VDLIGFMTFGFHIAFKCKEIGPKYLILILNSDLLQTCID